ncbi:hypothetical protein RI578_40755 (plasmid) [Streptomyces sp. BB1-1-1]|uniref:hypothetical protein n=1 Tax=unclassified Streptomyces TaxID=2593676 RepID=UPI000695DCBA|nr:MULTISPECIES: hypothetical protein [unclassified Streptomyces]OLO26029.1 hypothetical protein PZ61_0237305 [Streptomyces sp. MNU77]WND40624.1 hypothetical protein RI578_40755 [Streptomyces sp. BB1-1-1]
MIPADADELVTSQDIAEKYEANEGNVAYWTTLPGFPEGWPSGPGRTLVRDAALVDEWLKENLPVHWAKGQDSDNPFGLPAGGPKDLVTLSDICAWEGKALGRTEPVPEATLRSYMSKKPPKMPGPDRVPGDGKAPEVTERRWFRETAYAFVNRPRRMRRQTKAEEPVSTAQAPAAGSALPSRSSTARTEHLDAQAIATTYSVSGQTARGWIRAEGFPEAGERGYNAADVDEWVRENRRRTWVTAQRRAQLSGHAWAGPSAADEDAGAEKKRAAPAPAAEPAAEAQGEQAQLTAEMIGPRYGVSEYTGLQWTKVKEKREGDKVVRRAFPAPRSTQPRTYDQREVDAWVEKHRPHVWAAFKGTGPALVHDLPEGDPRDLLDIYDFAEVLGMTTRGEALARETIRAYHARGQVPYADRTADDGKKPRVFQDHWYRETVYGFVLSRRGSGRFGPRR